MTTCSIEGCGREVRSRQLCRRHYDIWRTENGGVKAWSGTWLCAADGCSKRRKCTYGRPSSPYCPMHNARQARHGDVTITHSLSEKTANPGYRTVHSRIAKKHGPASEYLCIGCGQPADEWAYDHKDPAERTDPIRGLAYSDDPGHYAPMCRKCHNAFDDAIKPKSRPPHPRGELHHKSKLTEQNIREIRDSAAAGEPHRLIAERYGVSVSTVDRVVQRKTWTHVA